MTSAPSGVLALGSEQLVIPADLPAPSPGSGEVVLLLADPEVSENGWGARVGCELARHWAASGARVILADVDLPRAPLHGEIGVENEEGVSDLLLYGSSPFRVSRRIEGEDFLLITAGTIVADPEAVFRHSRWPGLLAAFRESGCALVLYLPADLPGYDALLPEGDRVLQLSASAPAGPPRPGVLVLVPEVEGVEPGTRRVSAKSAVAASEVEVIEIRVDDDHSTANLLQAVAEVEREAKAAAARRAVAEGSEGPDEDPEGGPPPHTAGPTPSAVTDSSPAVPRPVATRKAPWILLVILLAVVVLLLLGWMGYLPLPGMSSVSSRVPQGEAPLQLFTPFSSLG